MTMNSQKQNLPKIAVVVLLVGLAGGCASIKTSQLYRTASGKFFPTCHESATRGVPCKFQIETGVRAEIFETIFVSPETGVVMKLDTNRLYSVKVSPIKTDQNFLVHIPRPLAGTLDLTGNDKGYGFTNDGYLKSIGGSITDNTIKDITTILGDASLGGFIKKNSADSDTTSSGKGAVGVNRLIAVREFLYSDPNWLAEFNGWVGQYQDCNSQCEVCQP